MLSYVRDTLVQRAADRRSFYDQHGDPEWRTSPDGQVEIRRIVALEAAADVFTFLHGKWADGEVSKKGIPDWLKDIANQGMSAFKLGLEK